MKPKVEIVKKIIELVGTLSNEDFIVIQNARLSEILDSLEMLYIIDYLEEFCGLNLSVLLLEKQFWQSVDSLAEKIMSIEEDRQ